MSFDPISAAMDLGGKLIERLIPDPAAKAQASLELLKMQQDGTLAQLTADTDLAKAQLAVNQVEAGSTSVFVSGWRPFIGWTCGSGLAYQFVASPLLTWLAALVGHPSSRPRSTSGPC
jgi:hypothetical protein